MKNTPENTPKEATLLSSASKSNLWFYPGEVLKKGEMRVTLMGTGWGNVVSPVQKGPSIFVELGNEAQDSFVFDVGPGCILNYNAMEIPMSRMNKVFLSHLHMDHCSDLPFIYAFGPNLGDRFEPLYIHGPSGPLLLDENGDETETTLGTKNLIKGMEQFTQWHTTSFKTMTAGADKSYALEDRVKELDYTICGGTAHESGKKGKDYDHVIITHFPAIHIIDGAISYRLEWSPAGQEEYLIFVYSGDTLPNDFMIEYGAGADIMIHETAPSVESIMNGAGSTKDEALAIVCNSHTPANSLGAIIAQTKPQLAVTTHSPMDPRSIESLITGVWKGILSTQSPDKVEETETGTTEKQQYQVGADLMVFNIYREKGANKSTITTRMSALIERPWPVRIQEAEEGSTPPLENSLPYYRKGIAQDAPAGLEGLIFNKSKICESQQCKEYLGDQCKENKKDGSSE